MRRRFEIDGTAIEGALLRQADGYALQVGDAVQPVALSPARADSAGLLQVGDRSWPVHVARDGDITFVQIAGRSFAVRIVEPLTAFAQADAARGDLTARAPMPGTVVSVRVQPGAAVGKGETLMVIESMKLETAITASRDGIVGIVHAAVGDTFDRDAPLVSLAPETAE
jgi:biotin carboxyl carrier protein